MVHLLNICFLEGTSFVPYSTSFSVAYCIEIESVICSFQNFFLQLKSLNFNLGRILSSLRMYVCKKNTTGEVCVNLTFCNTALKHSYYSVFQIHFHKGNNETIYQYFPKECLPQDYGGELPTLAELHGIFK